MDNNNTRRRLDEITDAGLFEKLATAVLREQDPRCRHLAHVGVNAEGRTVKSPSDAIVYISDEGQSRMMVVHHTTCQRRGLRRKWLADPQSDFEKTLQAFRNQRKRIVDLRATLILTTNREPQEDLVHEIQAAGHEAGMDIEIYTGSDIAHFLDAEPRGQWLRRKYLGVAQTQLSGKLLYKLSVKSIEEGLPDTESWVQRDFDEQLADHSRAPVSFIVGESGMGKTVACLKCLESHIGDDGFGLLITAEVLGESRTLADAVDTTLRELHPPLAIGEGKEALAFGSETAPLLVVVEDVNRSASPAGLLEKLVTWGRTPQDGQQGPRWRVLCPVWPRTTALLSDSAYEAVSDSSIWLSCFTEEEGIAAVQRRRAEPLLVLGCQGDSDSPRVRPVADRVARQRRPESRADSCYPVLFGTKARKSRRRGGKIHRWRVSVGAEVIVTRVVGTEAAGTVIHRCRRVDGRAVRLGRQVEGGRGVAGGGAA